MYRSHLRVRFVVGGLSWADVECGRLYGNVVSMLSVRKDQGEEDGSDTGELLAL